jgi:GT2 family glycosyltransferase
MVGAVVVTYNSADDIGACLDSCRHLETVVVDNASQDDTLQQVRQRPWVHVIANMENLGFAAAVNQGTAALEADHILILNPDIRLRGSLQPLVEACARPGTAGACGLLVDEQGQPQHGFSIRRLPEASTLIFEVLGLNRLLPRNPINRRYRCLDLDLGRPQDVQQPAGAFLLFRRDAWQKLGGMDTQFYPVWFEDVDLCRRAFDRGLAIRYVPEVSANHRGGRSIAKLSWSRREVYWYASLLRYASKYFSAGALRALCLAVGVGSVLRALVAVAQRRDLAPCQAYGEVIRLAGSYALKLRPPDGTVRGGHATESSRLGKVDLQSRR